MLLNKKNLFSFSIYRVILLVLFFLLFFLSKMPHALAAEGDMCKSLIGIRAGSSSSLITDASCNKPSDDKNWKKTNTKLDCPTDCWVYVLNSETTSGWSLKAEKECTPKPGFKLTYKAGREYLILVYDPTTYALKKGFVGEEGTLEFFADGTKYGIDATKMSFTQGKTYTLSLYDNKPNIPNAETIKTSVDVNIPTAASCTNPPASNFDLEIGVPIFTDAPTNKVVPGQEVNVNVVLKNNGTGDIAGNNVIYFFRNVPKNVTLSANNATGSFPLGATLKGGSAATKEFTFIAPSEVNTSSNPSYNLAVWADLPGDTVARNNRGNTTYTVDGSSSTSNNPCAGKGGLKAGAPVVDTCGGFSFDHAKANQPKGPNHPYCGKLHQRVYTCSDNTPGTVDLPNDGICDADPWCPDPTIGTGDTCPANATGVAGNGKCPANKPLCNNPGTPVTPECVAPGDKDNTQFCSKKEVCNSNYCDSATKTCKDNPVPGNGPTCEQKHCYSSGSAECKVPCNDPSGNNYTCEANRCKFIGSGATPTKEPTATPIQGSPTPTPTPFNDCPIIDSDGLPNTCWAHNTNYPGGGYTLKNSALAHQYCDTTTNHANPWCWHKNASTTPTSVPSTILGDGCPNIDADNKPNTCEAAPVPVPLDGKCQTPGYSHKSPNKGGDDACTIHRNNNASWCCHQY